jgi:hypothetical protein
MASVTRVNGSVGAVGTLHSVAQLDAYLITCKDTGGSAVNIQASTGADEVVESVIREVQPLMYLVPNANGGVVHVVVDGHAVDADTLQARLRNLGTVDSIDLTGTTVEAGAAIAVTA